MRDSNKLRRRIAAVGAIVVGIGFVGTQFTGATLTSKGATYNMADGDLVKGTDNQDDWWQLAAADGYVCGDNKRVECKDDISSGRSDDSFGNGTKEDTLLPSRVTGSIPNNKSDLKRYYVSSEVTTVPSTSPAETDNILYLAWERVQDPSGSTNMDFEFNKLRMGEGWTSTSTQVTPVRSHGDLLVSYDLANGGTRPTITYRRWIASSIAVPSFGACQASPAPPCWSVSQTVNDSNYEGSINTVAITDPFTNSTLSARTFGEAAIDLNASGILPRSGECYAYGSVFMKSRSSDSFTAAVKDFIAPTPVAIQNCGSLEITKVDSTDSSVKLAGASFELYTDDGDGAFDDESAVSGATCTTASGAPGTLGKCTIANVRWGNYWLSETAAPSGYTASDPVQIVVAEASGTATETVSNTPIPGSVTVTKTDDASTPNPVAGAGFTLYADDGDNTYDAGDTTSAGTCTTGDGTGASVLGECTISDVAWGVYWLVETTTPTGYTGADEVMVTVSRNNRDIDQTVVNNALFKVITLVCDNQGNLVAGTVNYGDGSGNLTTATSISGVDDEDVCAVTAGTLTAERGDVLPTGINVP